MHLDQEKLWRNPLALSLALLALVVVALTLISPWEELRRRAATSSATEETVETVVAEVIEVLEEGTVPVGEGMSQPYQRLRLRLLEGAQAGEEVIVEDGTVRFAAVDRRFHPGDRAYVQLTVRPDGAQYYITEIVRSRPLLLLVLGFVAVVTLVGRGKGLRSLLGTAFSLAVVFLFVVPQVLVGRDPLLVSIIGAVVLLAVSTYLVYGWNPKAHAALGGMMLSLLLTAVLASLAVAATRLTGLGAEESFYVVVQLGPDVRFQRLALGGIIIGSLGILGDVCVSQASAVFELHAANPQLGWAELYRRGFHIGQDHIAASVNTLLLAYMGASMPLMLLFLLYQEPLTRRINREPVAEEIVRTLVGSTGLVLAVPITGLIAALMAARRG